MIRFDESVKLIFKNVPEFQLFYKDDLDPGYYNMFLSDFGLFIRNAIVNNEPYALKCLNFIDDTYNQLIDDGEFINMLNINILETLTDGPVTQRASIVNLTNHCLSAFIGLIRGGGFNDLTGVS